MNNTFMQMKSLCENLIYDSYKNKIYKFIIENSFYAGDFEYHSNPEASIIIPVKNEYTLTAALLNSVKINTLGIKYEVIIADDNSDDNTAHIEEIYRNVKRVPNNTGTAGFLYNVRNAVSKARGKYIFLMNNDMLALPGYLNELLKVMENDDTIGIAGSKTLNRKNIVIECGAFIRPDGYPFMFGTGENADFLDDKSYIECSYCSGCSILFKHSVWDKAGGFDVNYAPAYYEDSDFAFNLKYNFGLKTVCAPKSKLYHFEHMSYQKYIDQAQKMNTEFTEKNKQYFLSKWGEFLKQ